jgi:ribosomal protein S24E
MASGHFRKSISKIARLTYAQRLDVHVENLSRGFGGTRAQGHAQISCIEQHCDRL